MLFPPAHLQIAWIKHQSREGGSYITASSTFFPFFPLLQIPSPFITLINNLYLIGLSWNSQIGLLGSWWDGEENNSDRPSICFCFFTFLDGWRQGKTNTKCITFVRRFGNKVAVSISPKEWRLPPPHNRKLAEGQPGEICEPLGWKRPNLHLYGI